MSKQQGTKVPTTQNDVYDYETYSKLVGPFSRLPKGKYKVAFRRLTTNNDTVKAVLLTLANIVLEVGFIAWLCAAFLTSFNKEDAVVNAGVIAIVVGIIIVELLRLINTVTLCASTLAAKDPIPVRPQAGTRVAFLTAIVPSKEPYEMLEKTLVAMTKVKHRGQIDAWLLDEGGLPSIRHSVKKLGVNYFTRHGIEKWNTLTGKFAARTKHGNYNAWLEKHGHKYDYILAIDGDHVPRPNYAQRMLGYFRDPDVAFVVGPQVYGNYDNFITKGAESQAHIFQAAIQRGGNHYHSAMFVGTNNAFRVSAWESINGFQDSITEDMLTSMVALSTRNPKTGQFWRSVYTPDVVAVGEGPSSWTDFFSQQLRWARGANEIVLKNMFQLLKKLPMRARIHYGLITSFYPTAALGWVSAILVSILYLVMGNVGPEMPSKVWLALYLDVVAVQILLYAWLRKYNVSPHEPSGTVGFAGILFSMISGPLYVTALVTTLLRRKAKFVVTPKGDSASPDTWKTFTKHLIWSGLLAVFVLGCIFFGEGILAVSIWCLLPIAVCWLPIVQWQVSIWPETKVRLLESLSFAALRKLNKFIL